MSSIVVVDGIVVVELSMSSAVVIISEVINESDVLVSGTLVKDWEALCCSVPTTGFTDWVTSVTKLAPRMYVSFSGITVPFASRKTSIAVDIVGIVVVISEELIEFVVKFSFAEFLLPVVKLTDCVESVIKLALIVLNPVYALFSGIVVPFALRRTGIAVEIAGIGEFVSEELIELDVELSFAVFLPPVVK